MDPHTSKYKSYNETFVFIEQNKSVSNAITIANSSTSNIKTEYWFWIFQTSMENTSIYTFNRPHIKTFIENTVNHVIQNRKNVRFFYKELRVPRTVYSAVKAYFPHFWRPWSSNNYFPIKNPSLFSLFHFAYWKWYCRCMFHKLLSNNFCSFYVTSLLFSSISQNLCLLKLILNRVT